MKVNGNEVRLSVVIYLIGLLFATGVIYNRIDTGAKQLAESRRATAELAVSISEHVALDGAREAVTVERISSLKDDLADIKRVLARVDKQTK